MWGIAREFGLESCLRAVGAGLLGVRATDRDVKGGVGVAQGGREDIRRQQVSARDEPRDLHLSRAVAGLNRCVHQRGDRVVTARSFAHRAAGRVGRARVQGSGLAGSTRHGFARPSAAQAQADRVDVLLRFHHGTVMRVEAPRPRVIDLGVPKFLQPPASPPGALLLMHLEQAQMHARVHSIGDEVLDLQAFLGQGVLVVSSPPSGVMPRACRREGVG